jgi:hypothetical protein
VTFQRPTGLGEQSSAVPGTAPAATNPATGDSAGTPPTITSLSRAAAGERMVTGTPSGPIARLQYLDAADAWPGGAAPLVRWLRANPDVVGDLLGVPLRAGDDEVPGLEASLFHDPSDHLLLLVAELGSSTERMLGALLTLMTTTAARSGVWICGEPRADHVAAMSWLNRATDGRFFVVRVRAARIGSSEPAPILELAMRPPRATDLAGGAASTNGPVAEGGRRADDHREFDLGELSP